MCHVSSPLAAAAAVLVAFRHVVVVVGAFLMLLLWCGVLMVNGEWWMVDGGWWMVKVTDCNKIISSNGNKMKKDIPGA